MGPWGLGRNRKPDLTRTAPGRASPEDLSPPRHPARLPRPDRPPISPRNHAKQARRLLRRKLLSYQQFRREIGPGNRPTGRDRTDGTSPGHRRALRMLRAGSRSRKTNPRAVRPSKLEATGRFRPSRTNPIPTRGHPPIPTQRCLVPEKNKANSRDVLTKSRTANDKANFHEHPPACPFPPRFTTLRLYHPRF